MEEPINSGIEELSEEELRRLDYAQQMFIKQGNPMPQRRTVGFWDILGKFGLEVLLRILSTIGAALVSATAVGAVAKITMIKLQEQFSVGQELVSTDAIFYWSMLAFEGGLMAAGMTEGRKNQNLEDNNFALVAGFVVTIAAGLLRSFTLINNSGAELFLSVIFAIAIALAGPVVAYFGSKNFGHILQEIQNLQSIFDEEWQLQLEEWQAAFDRYWVRVAKNVYGVDRRKKARFEDEQPRTRPPESEPEPQGGPSIRSQLKSYLIWQGISPTEVGNPRQGARYSPKQIAEAMGMPEQHANIRKYLQGLRDEYLANPEAWARVDV